MDLRSEISSYSNPGNKPMQQLSDAEVNQICQWILDLRDINKRENALAELSKNRDRSPNLAVWIWQSFGTMNCILRELFSAYVALSDPFLTTEISNRVGCALTLLQTVASHPDTRQLFLESRSLIYLYPFLNTDLGIKAYDSLKLASLGVVGAMLKTGDAEAVKFMLSTEMIPICLHIMAKGNELLRIIATFILEKILMDEYGLQFICDTYNRFSSVAVALEEVLIYLTTQPSVRLLKHVMRCYARFSDNDRAAQALAQCLPEQLRKNTFAEFIGNDQDLRHCMKYLHENIRTHTERVQ